MSQPLLNGRVGIITEASRGIGAATARAFVEAGAAVALAAHQASFITGTVLALDGGKLAGMAPFSAGSRPSVG